MEPDGRLALDAHARTPFWKRHRAQETLVTQDIVPRSDLLLRAHRTTETCTNRLSPVATLLYGIHDIAAIII